MNAYWGYHLILDCKTNNLITINSKECIRKFSKQLVEKIKMVPFGEPFIESFANHDPSKGGITLIQLIETSNITCHFVANTGEFYLDIFSCECYDIETVIQHVRDWFSPESIRTTYLTRQA